MPRREHVATMLRADLDDARSSWIAGASEDASERVEREGADFLAAEDHDGRLVDFHTLRQTTGAGAAISGASPKAIQTLVRQSKITPTLDTHGHRLPNEAAKTVARSRPVNRVQCASRAPHVAMKSPQPAPQQRCESTQNSAM